MFKTWNLNISDYEFLNPNWFYALLIIPFLIFWIYRKEKKRFGDLKFTGSNDSIQGFFSHIIRTLRWVFISIPLLVTVLLIIALAKPYSWNASENKHEENKFGIDIILALDVSLSMLATDFAPNRLEVAKNVMKDFINSRKGDKIGLVVFSGEAYTACPTTMDYSVLISQLEMADGMRLEPGTAIGTGLGTAVVQLRNDQIKSKVIILLTDGSNNYGDISPNEAALLAKQKNICVYTIGVGTNGIASTPIITPTGVVYEDMAVEIDEQTLTEIAKITGGDYFRAKDEEGLRAIYKKIDAMEKRKISNKVIQSEPPATPFAFLNWALVLSFIYLILQLTLFIPNYND